MSVRLFDVNSNIVRFTLKHATTGVGLTGLSSASSGLVISTICDNEATATVYTVAASNIETITTLGTFAAPSANKCRFKEVDATNHKGLYEFQFADARFGISNARVLVISVTGATNLLDADYEIELPRYDPFASDVPQTGDSYVVVNHASYGNAQLVRSTTPENTLSVDAAHKIPATVAAADVSGNPSVTVAAYAAGLSPLRPKKNVAISNFIFPMFDSVGALKSGLTVAASLCLDGGSFAAATNQPTEIGTSGWYRMTSLTAGELNADVVAFSATASGAVPTTYTILTEA